MFITFEGIEGCGKSTQVRYLAGRLKDLDIPHTLTLEPGGTKIGQGIRQILLDAKNRHLFPLTELLLYAADRAQHVGEVIKPALDSGLWVLCDRFYDATTVYQGYARGEDMKLIKLLNTKASQGISPDLTFLLDCPVEIGLKRAEKREEESPANGQDRFEKENSGFHEAVRKGYLTLAGEDAERFLVIDATLTPEELETQIFGHLRRYIP